MPLRILFLCIANSARSQMAEGLARRAFGDRAVIQSAGRSPAIVHPRAIAALREIGIDISTHESKSVRTIDFATVDLVITLCADDVCPAVPDRVERLHWPLQDPAGALPYKAERRFRETREDLQRRLEALGRERGLFHADTGHQKPGTGH